jgi:hypothetical protein
VETNPKLDCLFGEMAAPMRERNPGAADSLRLNPVDFHNELEASAHRARSQ